MFRTAALTGLLLILVPAASAQVPSYAIQMDFEGVPDSLIPGSKADFTLIVSRACSMQGQVLPAETVQIETNHASELQIGGSRSIHFAQFTCTTELVQEATEDYSVAIDQYAEVNRTFAIQFEAYPGYYQPPMQPAESALQELLISVAAPPANDTAATQQDVQPEKEAPAPAAALLVMALLLVVVAIRRRQA